MAGPSASRIIMLATASLLLAGCAGEATAPAAATHASQLRTSPFVPNASQRALVGVADGVYAVTFDPRHDQSFSLGPNHLDIPANSVCDLASSGYGADYWNQSCAPERGPVTISVTIRNSQSDTPEIDFQPAMRFNPTKSVELYIYAEHATQADASVLVMNYCNDLGACVDESLQDSDLQTYVDSRANVVFRRVKHFSGYVVAERSSYDSFMDY
ncbi:MAG: hypothetical protein ACHQRK_11255 [Gemmatimonadales bacterium]